MKRRAEAQNEPQKKRKCLKEDSSDEDEESSQRTTSQDSSESPSDGEDQRPSFSRPSDSQNAESSDAVDQSSSKFSMYNSVSQKLMAKMGFRVGEGLGKYGQGRKEIIEASTQRGRRGLGLTLKGFQGDLNVDWQDEPEPSAIEEVTWFPECSTEIPDADELRDWMAVGPKKLKIEDETEFCTENLLHLLLRCKSVFDNLEGEEMRRARTRSNPYETIRGAFFLNRAAMKMANMDHVFDYMFTNPKDSKGKPQTRDKEGELLYFGDVCAGPGGFSEYVLWRRGWHAKGFGMTLKGANDFKLEDFFAAPSELFEPYYGEGGIDGDGDITRPENISAFRNFVLDSTEGRGLHFLMADGGFSVEGQENIQEILSKQLLLCQFLTAMSSIRTGGHFVCKTFDLFTPFSVGLIYLLYLCFERISLFKPITSRPANSERYVVCKGLKPGTDAVREYMFTINLKLNHFRHSDRDVTEVVPLEIIKADTDFFQYMINSNESHCVVQIKALAKIHAFVRDTNLFETRQADIRKECLKLWGVPDKARVAPSPSDPKSKFCELLAGSDMDRFNIRPTALNSGNLDKLQHVMDYRCIVGGAEQLFLLGLGKSQIYKWDGKTSSRWEKLDNFKLELPRETLLSVEIVEELKGEGKAQRRLKAVHILDALVLNGTDVRDQHFNQRIQLAEKFVKAVSKPSRPDMNPIRVKEVYRLEEMEKIFVRLEMKITKSSGGMPRLSYTGRDDRHFLPSGLYIIKTVNDPWTMAFSKNSKRKFFFNKLTKESTYELPPGSVAPFHTCHHDRLFWAWEKGVRVHDSQTRDPEKLSKDDLLSFIHQHYQQ
ncbi:cap-specific mRNA (nucleoside-2'-O-)-methyltransferase 1 [Misgurnus anguillicaudatus]|uniref:cap-specific mRNA (nucleoside-2'-O-)-methyltransferase 1 n=1 Tax=Misgurnus anguillicaudatus TaxID=75329 RepID=UPI0024359F83|nr:cap-specific mRNA (nucleoside-2'-O-)-methyltransferase 1 isoform X2 [Misgurnus anguillicaudatus]XP_055044557.1 cap-specific mRNA (nucleoside-2'-O-)-methyltransferase 1 isoform X2 [Misgurnus anguillicaudatus]